MLGVVSDQCPKGGALTLNAIAGIGMLAVGVLGFPYIGTLQTKVQQTAIVENKELQTQVPGLVKDGQVVPVSSKTIYEVLSYKTIDNAELKNLLAQLPEGEREAAAKQVEKVRSESNQRALREMAFFPGFMLVCYLALIVYFRAQGGYKPVDIAARLGRRGSRRILALTSQPQNARVALGGDVAGKRLPGGLLVGRRSAGEGEQLFPLVVAHVL